MRALAAKHPQLQQQKCSIRSNPAHSVTGKFTNFCKIDVMTNRPDPASIRNRRHLRTPVNIDVTIVGVLENFEATIADLSEGGAFIIGRSLPAKARCEIHFGGQIVYGLVMWSEIDRMGVRFPFELQDGPLHQVLSIARSHHVPRPISAQARSPLGFGRRGA
jgi:PilZ domain